LRGKAERAHFAYPVGARAFVVVRDSANHLVTHSSPKSTVPKTIGGVIPKPRKIRNKINESKSRLCVQ
jgi:hypothetical protein